MTTKTDLDKARAIIAQADADAAQAEAEKNAQIQQRTLDQQRAILDAYDPAQLRADVVAAEERLATEAAASGLSAALVDYLAAMIRETRLGSEAEGAAAMLGEPAPRRVEQPTDAQGVSRGMLDNLPTTLLAKAVVTAAKTRVDREQQEARAARVKAIHGTSDLPTLSEEERAARHVAAQAERRAARNRAYRAGVRAQEENYAAEKAAQEQSRRGFRTITSDNKEN